MLQWRRSAGAAVLACAVIAVVAACGDATRLPEAPATGALTSGTVLVRQTGDAQAQVDTSTVSFQLDDSGSLVMHLTITSAASTSQTVAARASLYDANGNLIGDATGGAINVAPGSSTRVQLNGPAPSGTIAAATVELTAQASPTPTAATPSSQLATPQLP